MSATTTLSMSATVAPLTHPRPQLAASHTNLLSDWLNISPYQRSEPDTDDTPSLTSTPSRMSIEVPFADSQMALDAEPLVLPARAMKNDEKALFLPSEREFTSSPSLMHYSSLTNHACSPNDTHTSTRSTSHPAVPLSIPVTTPTTYKNAFKIASPAPSLCRDSPDASLLQATPELFSTFTSSHNHSMGQSNISPVVRRSQGESTPITTLSDDEESQASGRDTPNLPTEDMTICTPHDHEESHDAIKRTFMERLTNASTPSHLNPNQTSSSDNHVHSPLCLNSPFQLRGCQFRPHTPASSSPLSSVTYESDTPAQLSRPNYATTPRPPKRFKPSPLSVNLTPSWTDTFTLKKLRAFEEDGHRYRTRSKLRSLRSEIEAHEKDADLNIIRSYMKKEDEEIFGRTRRQTKMINSGPKLLAEPKATKETSATPEAAPSKPSGRKSPTSAATVKAAAAKAPAVKAPVARATPTKSSAILAAAAAKRSADETDTPSRPSTPAKRARRNDDAAATAKARTSKPAAASVPTQRGAVASGSSTNNNPPLPPIPYQNRTFPPSVPVNPTFPLMYRRFPLCTYFDPNNPRYPKHSNVPAGGIFNPARNLLDLYTPRFVKGIGRDKVGLCPICYESRERGGLGKTEWLSMKFSAFNYHMQYAHGISPTTALPFSPPIEFRTIHREPNHKNEKEEMLEGMCHKCQNWIPLEGVKCVEAKLKEIYWWKHAAACHKGSTLEGETDAHIEDELALSVMDIAGIRRKA